MNVNCLDQIQPLPTLIKILEKSRENTKKGLLKIAWDFLLLKSIDQALGMVLNIFQLLNLEAPSKEKEN